MKPGDIRHDECIYFEDVLVHVGGHRSALFDQAADEDGDHDPLLCELLEAAGTLDIADGAWLCRIGHDGMLRQIMARVGSASQAEAIHVLKSMDGWINHSGTAQALQVLSGGREYLVCTIGDQSVERVVLALRARPSSAASPADLRTSAARIQRLVSLGLSIGGMAAGPPVDGLREVPALDLVDLCPFGILVVDLDQIICLANKAMLTFFDNSALIGNFSGRFEIFNSDDAVRFHVALRSVLSAPLGKDVQQTMALTNGNARPILLSIARLSGEIGAPRACIIVTDPAANYRAHIQPLAQVFALTPVEIRLVTQLVHGSSLQDAAQRLKLKIETARTYLKQIFQKTGTHRQLELVELMKGGALPSLT